jgi:hypothetical protein
MVFAASGATAGSLSAFVCSPIDVVRVRLQVHGALCAVMPSKPTGFVSVEFTHRLFGVSNACRRRTGAVFADIDRCCEHLGAGRTQRLLPWLLHCRSDHSCVLGHLLPDVQRHEGSGGICHDTSIDYKHVSSLVVACRKRLARKREQRRHQMLFGTVSRHWVQQSSRIASPIRYGYAFVSD